MTVPCASVQLYIFARTGPLANNNEKHNSSVTLHISSPFLKSLWYRDRAARGNYCVTV
jgi:hypothetical protein